MNQPPSHDHRQAPVGVTVDHWSELRRHTAARIALGRSGSSLPTREWLRFEQAHALARDAVHTPLDVAALQSVLHDDDWATLAVRSRAPDRAAYLARPDWGRRLDEESRARLASLRADAPDVALVVSDGLSSAAVQSHAAPFLHALKPMLEGVPLAPIVVATQARVALADEIGELLGARLAVSLIGERPGLSSPDSLGLYVTYEPRVGRTDAERNCLSNVRPEGLPYGEAALRLAALIRACLQKKLSGVALCFDPGRAIGSS